MNTPLTRRSLLGAMLAASCGPAIVRVASLMPVRAVPMTEHLLSVAEVPAHMPLTHIMAARDAAGFWPPPGWAEILRPGLEELFAAQYEARA